MSGPGDIDGEVSGDEAAWRDLIARFDVPADRTGNGVPWPASEDLPDSGGAATDVTTRSAESRADPGDQRGSTAKDGASATGHDAAQAAYGLTQAERDAGQAGHGPAVDDPDARQQGRGSRLPGRDQGGDDPGTVGADRGTGQAEPGAGRAGRGAGQAEPQVGKSDPAAIPDRPASPGISFAVPTDRTRVIRSAGDPRSYTPAEEEDEPFVPPPLPPPARLDTATKAALAGVIGGPGYLLIATIFLHWTISAEAALIAVAAFVAGFVMLIVKLGDRPGRDDDDDGAVL